MVYFHIIFLILGFILLIKGSDFFVESSSRIAKKFGVSEFVIGLTLVAIGTSIPELSASIIASLKGDSGIIVGNVIGSNIANIGLILGLGAFVASIKIKRAMLRRDAYMMLFISVLFYVLAFDGFITIIEGIFFLLLFVSYTLFIVTSKKSRETYDFRGFLKYFFKLKYLTSIKDTTISRASRNKNKANIEKKKKYFSFNDGLLKDFLIIVVSGVAIVFGAKYLVSEAIWLAQLLGVSTSIIGVTMIALGTSLPELSVSFRAAKRGFGDMIIGNIVGSNIANILLIFGISSLINPIEVGRTTLFYTAPAMLIISLILLSFMRSKWKIGRKEGIILLIFYVIFIFSVIVF
jgi:cation:H+ antiporter